MSNTLAGKMLMNETCDKCEMAKILIVDDDVELAQSVNEFLTMEQHVVDMVHSADEGLDRVKNYNYDLIILDVNLPDGDGMQICQSYREIGGTASVLMLTGQTQIKDKERGLDSGADDYLTKPFHPRELSARLRALMRRSHRSPSLRDQIELKDLVLNLQSKTVTRYGEIISLKPREYALLEFLARNKGVIFSQESILDRVWSSDSDVSPDTVRVHVTHIRKKLGYEGDSLIRTVHRQGYCID